MNPKIENLKKVIEEYNPDAIFQPNAEVLFQPTPEVNSALEVLEALLSVFKDPSAMTILFRENEIMLQLKSFSKLLTLWPLGNIVLLQQSPANELITEILDYPLFVLLMPNLHQSLTEMMDIGASYLDSERNLKALAESIVGAESVVGEKSAEAELIEDELMEEELMEEEVQFEIIIDPPEETVSKRPPALFIPDCHDSSFSSFLTVTPQESSSKESTESKSSTESRASAESKESTESKTSTESEEQEKERKNASDKKAKSNTLNYLYLQKLHKEKEDYVTKALLCRSHSHTAGSKKRYHVQINHLSSAIALFKKAHSLQKEIVLKDFDKELPTDTQNYGQILRKLKISHKNAVQELEGNCIKSGKVWRIKKAASKNLSQKPLSSSASSNSMSIREQLKSKLEKRRLSGHSRRITF